MKKRIQLIFENEGGRRSTISLNDPVEPVDPAAVKTAMNTIITENAFSSSGGDLIKKYGARIVSRSVEDIDIS